MMDESKDLAAGTAPAEAPAAEAPAVEPPRVVPTHSGSLPEEEVERITRI